MQVILLEKIRNLGGLGDVVNVRSGYGRNYLVPQGKAVFASEENAKAFELRRAELEKKAQEQLSLAEAKAEKLKSLTISIEALASDEGKLYGSVGANEISQAINAAGVEINRSEIIMPLGPIQEIGMHTVDVQLHTDVVVTLDIQVDQPA